MIALVLLVSLFSFALLHDMDTDVAYGGSESSQAALVRDDLSTPHPSIGLCALALIVGISVLGARRSRQAGVEIGRWVALPSSFTARPVRYRGRNLLYVLCVLRA